MTTTEARPDSRLRFRFPSMLARGALAAIALVLCSAGQAEAQWGFGGFGGGFGWGFPHPYTPPSVSAINQRANVRSGMDQEALNRTSLGTPDRFAYRREQVAMQQRYDVDSGRGMEIARVGRGSRADREQAAPPSQEAGPTSARPVLEITSFVNADNQLVWPSDAPVSGDLIEKRDDADEAVKEVVLEYRAMDFSRINTVANARESLINYGQPALQFLRETSTERVADSFHLFLLSLYDSLAQAAERGAGSGGG